MNTKNRFETREFESMRVMVVTIPTPMQVIRDMLPASKNKRLNAELKKGGLCFIRYLRSIDPQKLGFSSKDTEVFNDVRNEFLGEAKDMILTLENIEQNELLFQQLQMV